MTNILLAQAAHRTPPGSFALCESEAPPNKAPSRNEDQPHVLMIILYFA
ncbi:hypothetical protein [Lysinibacillus sp. TE18511]